MNLSCIEDRRFAAVVTSEKYATFIAVILLQNIA
jgi:hypothetical protein